MSANRRSTPALGRLTTKQADMEMSSLSIGLQSRLATLRPPALLLD